MGNSSVHVMTVAARRITAAFYGREAARSYFAGCSTGGAEAMEEAEFYPSDYDGIEAGSPGQDYTHLMMSFLWGGLLPARNPAARLPPVALHILSGAVLRACGSSAEQANGFLLDPRSCHFEPASLALPQSV
jgi:feruloyl esterase